MTAELRVLWLQGVTCNGNAHSFLNAPELPHLLAKITLLHHPLLPCTLDLETVVACRETCDVLIVEGAVDPQLKRAGVPFSDLLRHYAEGARYVIAAGSCASFGGMFKAVAPERITGVGFDMERSTEFDPGRLINLPGCPLHPSWLVFALEMIRAGRPIVCDELRRPQELYAYLVHQGCSRNEYFEWKVDAERFGTKEGCLYYAHGCRAPLTHGTCNLVSWNESGSKTRSGQPCFGCTEPDFPRTALFETRTNMSIPRDVPFGVSKRNYLTLTGVAKTLSVPRLHRKLIDDLPAD